MQVCSQQILCFFALDMSLHKQFFLLYYIVPEFLARCVMIFPLEQLIKFKDNIYEITCAASRRAFQLSMVKDPVIEANDDKVVSVAAEQLFDKSVTYSIEN